jgi:hypothetical protein
MKDYASYKTESPIEEDFLRQILKHISDDVKLEAQVEMPTRWGMFRADFMVTTSAGVRIVYECDGADFHDAWLDDWRDVLTLGEKRAERVVRLRGQDIVYHLNDLLYALCRTNPEVFSVQGRSRLERLACSEIVKYEGELTRTAMPFSFQDDSDPKERFTLLARKMDADDLKGRFFSKCLAWAMEHPGWPVEQLASTFMKDISQEATQP